MNDIEIRYRNHIFLLIVMFSKIREIKGTNRLTWLHWSNKLLCWQEWSMVWWSRRERISSLLLKKNFKIFLFFQSFRKLMNNQKTHGDQTRISNKSQNHTKNWMAQIKIGQFCWQKSKVVISLNLDQNKKKEKTGSICVYILHLPNRCKQSGTFFISKRKQMAVL